jgi:type I restriction enzyme S subunit
MNLTGSFSRYASYKDSGVNWLGEIPTEWGINKLRYEMDLINGCAFKPSQWGGKGIPIIRIQNLNGSEEYNFVKNSRGIDDKYLITFGDIVFSWSGNVGTSFGAFRWEKDYPAYLNQHIFKVTNHRRYSDRYLYWLLKSVTAEVESNTHGIIGMVHITKSDLGVTLLPSVPIETQMSIARYLDQKTTAIDEAITKKLRLIELLNEQKAILINRTVTKGINPEVPMLDSKVEWIGDVPKHWELRKVKHIFRLIIEPAKKNNDHELLSVYTDIGVRPRKDLEERGNKASTTDGYWLVKKGDIIVNKLLAWMGAIGLSNYDGVTSPAYDILRPVVSLDGNYFHNMFRMKSCSQELKKHSRGIMDMRLRLYFDKFGQVIVPFPPVQEQFAISKKLAEIGNKFVEVESRIGKEIEYLNELKRVLIFQASTGKIKI